MTIKASNFPTTRPSLDLNFAQTKRLDPRVTFSRASSGTYTDVDGLIKSAATNVARFDHNPTTGESLGLLVEEARTNHVPNSLFEAGLDGASRGWNSPSGATLIKNSTLALAPDGTFTAVFLKEDSTNGAHSQQWTGINPNSFMTLSVFVKPVGRSSISISFWNSGSATFNLSTETVTVGQGTASIQKHNNGWYRLFLTSSAAMPQQNYGNFVISLGSYAGDNASGVLLWGVSYEAGSFPTSYIPTPATFTGRSSTATFYDSAGVIQTAASGVARSNAFFPDSNGVMRPAGLLLEAAGTNIIVSSQVFNSGGWTLDGASLTANAATAPDGTTTATSIVQGTGNNRAYHFDNSGVTGSKVFSIFAKANAGTSLEIRSIGGVSPNATATVNLSSGTVSGFTGATVQSYPNGWYRVLLPVTVSTASGSSTYWLISGPASSVLIWGAQLETGSYATSYIPTVASTVTRAADTSTSATVTRAADVTGIAVSSWYNPTEGTLFAAARMQYTPSQAGNFPGIYTSDGFPNRLWDLYFLNGTNSLTVGSDTHSRSLQTLSTSPQVFKVAQALSNTSLTYSASKDGATALTGGMYKAIFGTSGIAIGPGAGAIKHISRLTYWPTRLSDATLQAITR